MADTSQHAQEIDEMEVGMKDHYYAIAKREIKKVVSAKDAVIKEKNAAIKEKKAIIKEKNAAIEENVEARRQAEMKLQEVLKHVEQLHELHRQDQLRKDAVISQKDAVISQKDAVIGQKDELHRQDQLQKDELHRQDQLQKDEAHRQDQLQKDEAHRQDQLQKDEAHRQDQLQKDEAHRQDQLQKDEAHRQERERLQLAHRQDMEKLQQTHLFERLEYNRQLHKTLRALGCALIQQAISGDEKMIGYHSTAHRQLTQHENARPMMSIRGDGKYRGFELVTKESEKAVEIRCAMGFRSEVAAQVDAHVLCGFKRQTDFTRSANPDDFVDNVREFGYPTLVELLVRVVILLTILTCLCLTQCGRRHKTTSRPRKYLRSASRRCPV